MRRRSVLLVVAMAIAVLTFSGVALAVVLDGTRGDDTLRGSNGADTIDGRAGDDDIFGFRGADSLNGGSGADFINAGPRDEKAQDVVDAGGGNDRVRAFNRPAARDIVDCGRGFDVVIADSKDLVTNCNVIRRP